MEYILLDVESFYICVLAGMRLKCCFPVLIMKR